MSVLGTAVEEAIQKTEKSQNSKNRWHNYRND